MLKWLDEVKKLLIFPSHSFLQKQNRKIGNRCLAPIQIQIGERMVSWMCLMACLRRKKESSYCFRTWQEGLAVFQFYANNIVICLLDNIRKVKVKDRLESFRSDSMGKRSFAEVLRQSPTLSAPKPELAPVSNTSFWVKKETEVLNLNLNSLLMVSRLFAHYSWKEVKNSLEKNFQTQVSTNPFMEVKVILKVEFSSSSYVNVGKWILLGRFHLTLYPWSNSSSF